MKNMVALTLLMMWSSFDGAEEDPQTLLLKQDCSGFIAPNLVNFNQNLNASLADLRAQRKHFATGQSTSGTDPVYALFQCRNYLSITDCTACLATAEAQIRNCSAGVNGARVIYDGCFLRYESNDFFNQIMPRSSILCGNQTANESTTLSANESPSFSAAGQQVLLDLQIATPKITNFYAATKIQVGSNEIYAIAQCAETLTQDTCLDCLTTEHNSIQGCLPNKNGRAFDAGCFMRYSETPFFADNQTIDISPFLKQEGSSSKKWIIIGVVVGGVVVGGVVLAMILVLLFSWHKRSQSPKKVPRGNILEAINLKGPNQYRYSDLKVATKNFSEKNKLGEGGYGTVYKVLDDGEDEYLLRQVWKLYERGMHLELVDKTLDHNYDVEEVKKIIDIALLCTQPSPAMRPTMSEVVVLLNRNDLLEHVRPSMPIFIESVLKPHKDTFASTSSVTSNATTSNSIVPTKC
ncbi:hypothetical protein VNO78_28064 [Psophocarpus tetragonolobus]|uniref:Gnk2-homologous domain-containing protein n=1 Tax=Psophocarpus tetragonolobus TaxID=3891 RepID=A0AAN9S1A4_PSOTE